MKEIKAKKQITIDNLWSLYFEIVMSDLYATWHWHYHEHCNALDSCTPVHCTVMACRCLIKYHDHEKHTWSWPDQLMIQGNIHKTAPGSYRYSPLSGILQEGPLKGLCASSLSAPVGRRGLEKGGLGHIGMAMCQSCPPYISLTVKAV